MFIKVYAEQQYADAFIERGQLHMKTGGAFQRMEDDGSGRADPDDGMDHIFQKEGLTLSFKLEGEKYKDAEPWVIPSSDLAGPIKVFMNATRARHIFCAYAVTDRHIEMVRRDEPVFEERIAALGDYAIVITNPTKFLGLVKAAADAQGLALRPGLVDYVDLATHDGRLDPFKKDLRFAYQHEFRLMASETGDDFLDLDVGSLDDIAQRCLGRGLDRAVQEAIRTQLMDREPP
jgi:hypothetical protein